MQVLTTDETDRATLIRQVVEAQTAMLRILRARKPPELLLLDLTLGQLKALFLLHEQGPTAIGQIGAAIGVGLPAATLLVDALFGRGLVERFEDPADRRRTLARLTPRAQRLVSEEYLGSLQQYERWLDQLPVEQLEGLSRALQELAEIAGRDEVQAASPVAG